MQALGDDNRTVVDRGTLQVIDNQVDQTTGTVKLKAEFPNADLQLWPGQFVNVKLLVDTLAAGRSWCRAPRSSAAPTGPSSTSPMTTTRSRCIRSRSPSRTTPQAVIAAGIDEGERVVTTGFAQLTDGAKIAIGTPGKPGAARRQRAPPRPAARHPVGPVRADAASRRRRQACRADACRAPRRRTRPASSATPALPQRGRAATRPPTPPAPPAEQPRTGPQRRTESRRNHDRYAMSVSSPFIHRPIATSLLGVAVMLGGILGYSLLPVASLPQVDFPTIQVTTQLPGANAETIASLVTAPLERQFGQIPALSTMTSSSSYGISQITLQFDLNRDIDAAAQDVQSAINAAGSTLPRNLPYPPVYSKVNPADAPVMTLALTSPTISLRQMSDLADTMIAQRLSEVSGVGHVSVQGGLKPAIRIQADLARLASYGIALEDLRSRDRGRQRGRPQGLARRRAAILHHRIQRPGHRHRDLSRADHRLSQRRARACSSDVANVIDGLENSKVGGWYQGTPAVIIDIQRQPGANVIDTVRRIGIELPRLQRTMPKGISLAVVQDRTGTIRASVRDVQFTLVLSVVLVVMVVFMFLRTMRATIIAGVALPLSLVATFGVMWFCGFSLDNLSLMALTIGTGFVVDDAIVMIENIVRHMEEGEEPFEAALRGAKEIGFTVISLTVSLVAVFIPLLFMSGIVGRMFREFALTLTIAVITSAVVSLTLTPMMCSRLLRHERRRARQQRADAAAQSAPSIGAVDAYHAQPAMGAAPRARDARRDARDARRHDLALRHRAQGLPADPGHRTDHRRHRGGPGSLLRRDAAPAADASSTRSAPIPT